MTYKINSHQKLTGASIDPQFANMKPIRTIDEAFKEVTLSSHEVIDETVVDNKLFDFVRSMINVELFKGHELSPIKKMTHVKNWWHKNTIPFEINEEQEQKFKNAIIKAQLPLFECPLSFCKDKAEQKIAEDVREDISQKKKNKELLHYTLYELQSLEGAKTIYCSAKKLEDVLGQHSAKHWWELLNQLEYDGYIKKIKNGELKGRIASEFICIGHPCWDEDKKSKEKYEELMASVTPMNKLLKYVKKYKGHMGLITKFSLHQTAR